MLNNIVMVKEKLKSIARIVLFISCLGMLSAGCAEECIAQGSSEAGMCASADDNHAQNQTAHVHIPTHCCGTHLSVLSMPEYFNPMLLSDNNFLNFNKHFILPKFIESVERPPRPYSFA